MYESITWGTHPQHGQAVLFIPKNSEFQTCYILCESTSLSTLLTIFRTVTFCGDIFYCTNLVIDHVVDLVLYCATGVA